MGVFLEVVEVGVRFSGWGGAIESKQHADAGLITLTPLYDATTNFLESHCALPYTISAACLI
jgi:hypothetical protein